MITMVLNREQLIDHLDNTHVGQGSADLDMRIAADPETSQEWKQLRLAVDAVAQGALYDKVSTVKAAWFSHQSDAAAAPIAEAHQGVAIVRSISRVALRAAV